MIGELKISSQTFSSRLKRVYTQFKKNYTAELIEKKDGCEIYKVRGGQEPYTVKICFDKDGSMIEKSCTCPDYVERDHKLCKHIIGVMMKTGREYLLIPYLMEEL